MKPQYWAAGLILVFIFGCGRKPDPARLASNALKADTEQERARAAEELVKLAGELPKLKRPKDERQAKQQADLLSEVLAEMRRVVAESQDPEVLVIVIDGLRTDSKSFPLFFTAMDHPAQPVREVAFKVVLKLFSGSLPEKLVYRVDDPPEKRGKVTRRLQEIYEEFFSASNSDPKLSDPKPGNVTAEPPLDQPALTQTSAWADKLFDTGLVHDFGVVPRSTQLKYSFKMKNIYKVPLEITAIRITCGCLTVKESTKVLKPNEIAYLYCNMDATRFSGPKQVRIYVTVGPEYISTATLTVSGNARSDVVFNPGEIDFGLVHRGQTPTRSLDLEYYGGIPSWSVSEIVKNRPWPFDVKMEELPNRATRSYRLSATIKPDAPAGAFKQILILKTNDPTRPVLTCHVLGNVQATLHVAPSQLGFANVKVGVMESRKVVVRGSRPFRILGIDGQGDGISAVIPDGEATVHIVEIRFQPTKASDVKKQLSIRTNFDRQAATVMVEGSAGK